MIKNNENKLEVMCPCFEVIKSLSSGLDPTVVLVVVWGVGWGG